MHGARFWTLHQSSGCPGRPARWRPWPRRSPLARRQTCGWRPRASAFWSACPGMPCVSTHSARSCDCVLADWRARVPGAACYLPAGNMWGASLASACWSACPGELGGTTPAARSCAVCSMFLAADSVWLSALQECLACACFTGPHACTAQLYDIALFK